MRNQTIYRYCVYPFQWRQRRRVRARLYALCGVRPVVSPWPTIDDWLAGAVVVVLIALLLYML